MSAKVPRQRAYCRMRIHCPNSKENLMKSLTNDFPPAKHNASVSVVINTRGYNINL